LSTAMMYAFGNRADFSAVDEPFYAAYLARSGATHPMQDAILRSQPTDPTQVIKIIMGPHPNGAPHQYHKHMTHHMDGMPMDWLGDVTNVFLIRHPARVIASYARKRENPNLPDLGFAQQVAIYDQCRDMGQTPIVVDSDDILADPQRIMTDLCTALGLGFDPAMLTWRPGPRTYDGVWAAHWYDSVHASTGLNAKQREIPMLGSEYQDLLSQALPFYEQLSDVSIRAIG
ncbi:MAG: HAD family hydrolase, partial [Pseudomonadota bacterium]